MGGNRSSGGGGYSGYMQKYGDYSSYMGGNRSSGGGGYGNYSKYTGGSPGGGYGNYSKYTNYSKASGMVAAGGGDFMQKYSSGFDWHSFVPKNTSSSAGGAHFNYS